MIKFRVFDKRYNEYLPQHTINNMIWDALNSSDYIIELAAGLKDSQGNDIYIGDIVCYARDDENYLIGFDILNAMYSISNCNETMNFDNLYSDELEVIGNIHENKELLE